jgi:hypothetical protein
VSIIKRYAASLKSIEPDVGTKDPVKAAQAATKITTATSTASKAFSDTIDEINTKLHK